MKKGLILILTIFILFVCGCSKPKHTNNTSVNSSTKVGSNTSKRNMKNEYFFESNVSQANYNGKFLFNSVAENSVKLNINQVATLNNGKLYELKIDSVDGIPEERLNLGYFYVQSDKIYKINPTEENLNKLKNNGELPSDSIIVCQDSEMKDTLGKDKAGFHQYITIDGDKIEYHSYNNKVETGYYESFTWQKGYGLIEYRSGYGAEKDSIELTNGKSIQNSSSDVTNVKQTQSEDNNKTIDYNSYIKKVWIVKSWTNGAYEYSSFCISKIKNGKIEGKIETGSIIEPNDLYYSSDSLISWLGNFTGTISNGIAECQFSDKDGDKGTIKLVFKTKDEIEASIKYIDRSQDYSNSPLDGTFQFRSYNLNDLNGFSPFKDQSFTIDLDSWGNVNFVSGKFPAKYHVITMCLLTNKDGDILYNFDAPFPYAADVKAVSFKDVNKDGLKDVITIVGPHEDSDLYYASVFLQKADGSFKDDTELDHEIADSGNNKDIKSVTDYLSKKY